MADTPTQQAQFSVLYCEDEARDRTKFSDNHKDSEFDVTVCGDIEALPRMLAKNSAVPDLLVLDLYHSRYSPDSPEAEKAAAETKIIEDALVAVLEEVKDNANKHYQPRAISILKELRNQRRLRDLPVLMYTRQGMLAITDEELHEVTDYNAEWMLKGRKPETERRRMHSIIIRHKTSWRFERDIVIAILSTLLGLLLAKLL